MACSSLPQHTDTKCRGAGNCPHTIQDSETPDTSWGSCPSVQIWSHLPEAAASWHRFTLHGQMPVKSRACRNSDWSAIKKQNKTYFLFGLIKLLHRSKNSGTLFTDICRFIIKDTMREWPRGLETQDSYVRSSLGACMLLQAHTQPRQDLPSQKKFMSHDLEGFLEAPLHKMID